MVCLGDVGGGKEEVSEVFRIIMEKVKEYKKNKGSIDDKNSILESFKLISKFFYYSFDYYVFLLYYVIFVKGEKGKIKIFF